MTFYFGTYTLVGLQQDVAHEAVLSAMIAETNTNPMLGSDSNQSKALRFALRAVEAANNASRQQIADSVVELQAKVND